MGSGGHRVRVNDAVGIYKLPRALKRRLTSTAKRERVSASKFVRTAIIRLMADLKDKEKRREIVWR